MKITMTAIPILILSNSLKLAIKERVTKREVSDFKKKWCNENQLIAAIIKHNAKDYFIEPILDVGAGLGDIAYQALPDKKVICIDINKITDKDYPLAGKHDRIQIDFFDYQPNNKINTVLISHTLQFLDEDINLLNEKIDYLDPENIILVMNRNNDFLGELVEWSNDNFLNPNPEVKITGFPQGYKMIKSFDFKALLACDSFNALATQISYLMLVELNKSKRSDLVKFLKSNLSEYSFEFNQIIEIYRKNEN